MVDVLRENDTYVSQLRSAINEGAAGLSDVPALLRRVIEEDRWRERQTKMGVARFRYFEEFVSTPPLDGLGASIDILKRLCEDDKDALDLIDQAIKRPDGRRPKQRDLTVDNVNGLEPRPDGNSEQAAIRRLRKDRPDLLDEVKAGRMSAHAAMKAAGFRKREISIPDDPAAAARRLLKHFQADRLEALIWALSEGLKAE